MSVYDLTLNFGLFRPMDPIKAPLIDRDFFYQVLLSWALRLPFDVKRI